MRGGGWMTNDREQLLVPVRVTGSSVPGIGTTGKSTTPFIPGSAVYFAAGQLAYITHDVEFFFVH
jgi:hypothetical protein